MDKDLKKLKGSAKKYEKKLFEEEKKTLSIRVTPGAIEKISKRVTLLKANKEIPDKVTVPGYISKLIEEFASDGIGDKGIL